MRSGRIPRASIGVTVLRDPDYLELVSTPGGRVAWGLFVALVAAARDQGSGVLPSRPGTVARLVGWPPDTVAAALRRLAVTGASRGGPWLEVGATTITIRSYNAWNAHGGPRIGAGRPKSENQVAQLESSSCNQDVFKTCASSASASASALPPTPKGVNGQLQDDPPIAGTILDTLAFRAAWAEWVTYRRQAKHRPYTAIGLKKLVAKLAKEHGHDGAIDAINASIAAGWQGIFPGDRVGPADRRPANDPTRHHSGRELVDRTIRFPRASQ